jgi:cytidylate kinase
MNRRRLSDRWGTEPKEYALRFSKDFPVIAIFGKSCTGKSTVADALGEILGAYVRHCGEILRSRALEMGKPVSELSSEVHRLIDAETRAWAADRSASLKVVEGILLEELRGLDGILFIRLVCDTTVREARFRSRRGVASSITVRDKEDEQLRDELYSRPNSSSPSANILEFDTTRRLARKIAEDIASRITGGKF